MSAPITDCRGSMGEGEYCGDGAAWQDRLGAPLEVVNVAVGGWLALVPFLAASRPETTASVRGSLLIGVAVAALGASSVLRYRPWQEWALLCIGIWMLLRSIAFAIDGGARWECIVSATLVATVSGATLFANGSNWLRR